ncbi:MAG: squalene--hopene cyclase [Acidobacteria bacterium RIFCSPLOWO2_12_FULL_59_11]|nr:MAG: squalene--hopene cyclase [Acidobacteria bacterium RIFCSPLOWO2_12_FULL_59_11]
MSSPERLNGLTTFEWQPPQSLFPRPAAGLIAESLQAAIQYLLRLQEREGYWVGELEADSSLESDAILLDHYLGAPQPERVRKLANSLREQQTAEGGWSLYPGGSSNVSLTVKAYLALRLAGFPESDPVLRKAREMALQLGGIEAANSYTRIYLCLFGQYDWERVPAVVPELLLLPPSAYFNLYEVSAWTRAIVVPLSVIYAFQPRRNPPEGVSLQGLFVEKNETNGERPLSVSNLELSWKSFFYTADWFLATLERKQWVPSLVRRKALKKAEKWMVKHLEGSDGLGAIYPAMLNTILALDCLGYDRKTPLFARQLAEFWRLALEDQQTMWMQPCFPPVWDTAQAMFAAAASDLPPTHPALCRAAEWLLAKQVLRPGDWSVKNPKGKPGGWVFEFANDPFPDVDDTAMVLLALSRVRLPDLARQREAIRRGLEWMLSMQSSDGGWASFDRDVNKDILGHVPFADHNAMLDPSCADITGRVLETLAALGYDAQFTPARRAIQSLREKQESDGCWYGRWGVNYIYGTCFALRGLAAMGLDMREVFCLRAAEWLRSCQNPDGGWGEDCGSYDNPSLRGQGPSTAVQTAWALLGLFATDDFESESVVRGIWFLLEKQEKAGAWTDQPFTGTGFPSVFYLKYHLYSVYFPILALSEYCHRRSSGSAAARRLPELQIA